MLAKYLSPVDGVSRATSGFLLLVKNNGPTGSERKTFTKPTQCNYEAGSVGCRQKFTDPKENYMNA
jgi:hypothetical protein